MLAVKELGHVGLYCTDVQKSQDFYTRILGLTVTDAHPEGHIIFLSAQPESEHHELALCPGRDAPPGAKVVQQVSFIVNDLADLKQFHARLKEEGVRIRSVVNHGISLAIYFYDPDEMSLRSTPKPPYKIPQPFSEDVDLNLDNEALMKIAETGTSTAG